MSQTLLPTRPVRCRSSGQRFELLGEALETETGNRAALLWDTGSGRLVTVSAGEFAEAFEAIEAEPIPFVGGGALFRHYRNRQRYELLGAAEPPCGHSCEAMAAYRPLYECPESFFLRPWTMFFGTVEDGLRRFEPLG